MSKGKRIKELRELAGISQTTLANKIGVSKQTLYKYENDIVTNIPSDKIEALADALSTTPAYIMGWDDTQLDLDSLDLQIMDIYRELPPEKKIALLQFIKNITE